MILHGDALTVLKTLASDSVHCVITSPPYWGLRDYGVDGQIGLERDPQEFVNNLVAVFREIRRVLRPEGTCWINLGDSYTSGNRQGHGTRVGHKQMTNRGANDETSPDRLPTPEGLKPKDLVGIPWRVALALQADGWYLRSDIIWSKPNAMPESVRDRPIKSHEYIFLLSKSRNYYYDTEAAREPHQDPAVQDGRYMKAGVNRPGYQPVTQGFDGKGVVMKSREYCPDGRKLRTVWSIPTQGRKATTSVCCVERGGKTYKVSKDCLLHGQFYGSRTRGKIVYDEPQDDQAIHTPGSDNCHVQELEPESASSLCRDSCQPLPLDSLGTSPGDIGESRTSASSQGKAKSQNHHDIEGNSQKHDSDLSRQDSSTAILHSNQARKKVHVPVTSSPCTASAQKNSHTDDKADLSASSGPVSGIRGNSISADSAKDERVTYPSGQNLSDNLSISHDKDSKIKCLCREETVDHFAAYPDELVRRCILTGSSGECCSECGAPYVRIIRKRTPDHDGQSETAYDPGSAAGRLAALRQAARAQGDEYRDQYITTGWAPSCSCSAPTAPCTVLDPFAGRGTTLDVAIKLGRAGLGIELNQKYIDDFIRPVIQAAEKEKKAQDRGQTVAQMDAGQLTIDDAIES